MATNVAGVDAAVKIVLSVGCVPDCESPPSDAETASVAVTAASVYGATCSVATYSD